MWTKFLVLIALLVILFISISCDSSSNSVSEPEIVSPNDVSSIVIPNREHGYQFLENTVIKSSEKFDQFIEDVTNQQFWNNKDAFISVLQSEDIDFNIYNIIIFPHTEGSGSITVTPQEPVWEGGKVIIDIRRDVPEIGTADMAYYAFVYKVSKRIDEIIFVVDDSRIEITN